MLGGGGAVGGEEGCTGGQYSEDCFPNDLVVFFCLDFGKSKEMTEKKEEMHI